MPRLYGRRWKAASDAFIAANPLCRFCEDAGRVSGERGHGPHRSAPGGRCICSGTRATGKLCAARATTLASSASSGGVTARLATGTAGLWTPCIRSTRGFARERCYDASMNPRGHRGEGYASLGSTGGFDRASEGSRSDSRGEGSGAEAQDQVPARGMWPGTNGTGSRLTRFGGAWSARLTCRCWRTTACCTGRPARLGAAGGRGDREGFAGVRGDEDGRGFQRS